MKANPLEAPIFDTCGELGYNIFTCLIKKNSNLRTKWIWVPKGTTSPRANPSGPKKIWVPKKVT